MTSTPTPSSATAPSAPPAPETSSQPPATPPRVKAPGPRVLGTQSPTTTTADGGPGSSSDAGPQSPVDPLESGPTPSSPEPPADATPLDLKGRPLAEVIRGGVIGASEFVHHTLARTEIEQRAGVWLMTDEREAAGIADPLASIANRHAGGQLVSSDTADLVKAGIALAGYVVTNAIKAFQIRRAERAMRRSGIDPAGEQPREDQQ